MIDRATPGLVQLDGWLAPYQQDILDRYDRYQARKTDLGPLAEFASAYRQNGLHFSSESNTWHYREWGPRARALFLTGSFCNWDRSAHPLERKADGYWEITLPGETLKHGDTYKVHVVGDHSAEDRVPAFATYLTQDDVTKDFTPEVYSPSEPYRFQHSAPPKPTVPLIYEAHVGLSSEKAQVGTWKQFTAEVLPRIKKLGYNTIQLMAVAEHPYYGSFGYHVSNFFAASSRFGTPDNLKALIDTAHEMGLTVLMDLVHSHAVKNRAEGLIEFDGQPELYFHTHDHPQWDSYLFRYGDREVLRFLLSNLRWWLEEFRFDGFRFDGVTSMLYHHHGNISFDNYDKYFREGVEWDAVTYLQLANDLIHELNPDALCIAEDMSGMPGLCRPLEEGGMGFDYRLAMGIPDYWIKLLKHTPDEQWHPGEIYNTLSNRRYGEKTISYVESHDQALVGDKTTAFWLMDKEMYTAMDLTSENPIIDRGIAMHKLLRLLTLTLGGEAYLNFIGNEFGHPEWVDFPREGNDWSYHYCRRQWSLVDHPELRYQHLNAFDQALMAVAPDLLSNEKIELLNVDEVNQALQFRRGNYLVAINLSPNASIPDYRFPAPGVEKMELILSSDSPEFGGFDRVVPPQTHDVVENQASIYLPTRTALVFRVT